VENISIHEVSHCQMYNFDNSYANVNFYIFELRLDF